MHVLKKKKKTEAEVRKCNCTLLCFVCKSIVINSVVWRKEMAAIVMKD